MVCWHALCPGCVLPAPPKICFTGRRSYRINFSDFFRGSYRNLWQVLEIVSEIEMSTNLGRQPPPHLQGSNVGKLWKFSGNFLQTPLFSFSWSVKKPKFCGQNISGHPISPRLLSNDFGHVAPGLEAYHTEIPRFVSSRMCP